jgi:methionine-gamma-lyase
MIYVESVSNPVLNVADIPKLAEIAHRHNLKLVVDNTFSPLILTPVQHGADVIVYSLTKFINGTSDIIGGAVCSSNAFIESLMDLHMGAIMLLGPVIDPNTAFHVTTKLPHLGLRMKEHSRRAQFFAEHLEALGFDIHYPGLKSHPQHSVIEAMHQPEYGYGGVIALDLGTTEIACKFLNLLQNESHFGYIAVSLGFSDTLMSCSAITTSSELSPEDLKKAKISQGLVRFSIGYTGTLEQRWDQFYHALELLNEGNLLDKAAWLKKVG